MEFDKLAAASVDESIDLGFTLYGIIKQASNGSVQAQETVYLSLCHIYGDSVDCFEPAIMLRKIFRFDYSIHYFQVKSDKSFPKK